MISIYRKIFFRFISKIKFRSLRIIEAYDKAENTFIFKSENDSLSCDLTIKDADFYRRVVLHGEIGLGESFVDGQWVASDIEALFILLYLNKSIFEVKSFAVLCVKIADLKNKMLRKEKTDNTIENNKEQVGVAYNVGNDFFEMMLGPTVLYTCAIWKNNHDTLDDAQMNKVNLIIDKLKLKDSHSLLDIGHGWGFLANQIKEKSKCKVAGISLSENQRKYCADKYPGIQFEYQDYREHDGQYDRIVSLGMMEHVGENNLPVYFKKIAELLKPGGRAVLQTMTFNQLEVPANEDKLYLSYGTKYIMPNVEIPTIKNIRDAMHQAGSLSMIHLEDFGPHYGRTAHHWRGNLFAHKDEIIKRYSKQLFDMYDYNWAWFAAAYTTGTTGLVQIVIEKMPLLSNDVVCLPRQ